MIILVILTTVFVSVLAQDCCPHVSSRCETGAMEDLIVPQGFCLEIYAEVRGARTLRMVEDDEAGIVVFVGTNQRDGAIVALIDSDGDGDVDDRVSTDTSASNFGIGVAYQDGDLYTAETTTMYRYPSIMGNLTRSNPQFPPREVIYNKMSRNSWHSARYIGFGPDKLLYLSVGVPCNTCLPEDKERSDCNDDDCFFGKIVRTDVESVSGQNPFRVSDWELVAEGIRNSVGFDWQVQRSREDFWFTDNGRDWLGDDFPACEVNRVSELGEHFGFPYCAGSDPDPQWDSNCDNYMAPAIELGPHTAPLGMRFYTGGDAFPRPYNRGAFIAEHGSWNRHPHIGNRVMHARITRGTETLTRQPILEGFLTDNCRGTKYGRPTDVENLPDGSIIVADDLGGKVWRIYYDQTFDSRGLGLGSHPSLDEQREDDC